MNTDCPESTSNGDDSDSQSECTDWDSIEEEDDNFSYETHSGKDNTVADLETDSGTSRQRWKCLKYFR